MAQARRSSQVDKALMGLRALVLGGEFPPGTRLPEIVLADRLGISRTPLRQAMDRLVTEGLLERSGSGGCRTASFSKADVVDAIELRGVIEGTAARLAAERGADRALLDAAEGILAKIDAALAGEDFDAYVSENARFHRLLAELSGSPLMQRESERVSRLPLASPSAFLLGQEVIPDFRASLHRAQEQHREIVGAIRRREGARAEALAREHARLALRNLEHVMRGGPGMADRVPGLALLATA